MEINLREIINLIAESRFQHNKKLQSKFNNYYYVGYILRNFIKENIIINFI